MHVTGSVLRKGVLRELALAALIPIATAAVVAFAMGQALSGERYDDPLELAAKLDARGVSCPNPEVVGPLPTGPVWEDLWNLILPASQYAADHAEGIIGCNGSDGNSLRITVFDSSSEAAGYISELEQANEEDEEDSPRWVVAKANWVIEHGNPWTPPGATEVSRASGGRIVIGPEHLPERYRNPSPSPAPQEQPSPTIHPADQASVGAECPARPTERIGAEQAARCFFAAWQAGDRELARPYASEAAINELFQDEFTGPEVPTFMGCQDGDPPTCVYNFEAEPHDVILRFTLGGGPSLGNYVVSATFIG